MCYLSQNITYPLTPPSLEIWWRHTPSDARLAPGCRGRYFTSMEGYNYSVISCFIIQTFNGKISQQEFIFPLHHSFEILSKNHFNTVRKNMFYICHLFKISILKTLNLYKLTGKKTAFFDQNRSRFWNLMKSMFISAVNILSDTLTTVENKSGFTSWLAFMRCVVITGTHWILPVTIKHLSLQTPVISSTKQNVEFSTTKYWLINCLWFRVQNDM